MAHSYKAWYTCIQHVASSIGLASMCWGCCHWDSTLALLARSVQLHTLTHMFFAGSACSHALMLGTTLLLSFPSFWALFPLVFLAKVAAGRPTGLEMPIMVGGVTHVDAFSDGRYSHLCAGMCLTCSVCHNGSELQLFPTVCSPTSGLL